MSNELVETKDPTKEVNREVVVKYMDSFGIAAQLTKQEKEQFIEIASAYQLNPFKKEIYCIPYGQGERRKLSLITGFEAYLKRAERTGKLDGYSVITQQVKDDIKAVITIYRKDWTHPFVHEVYMSEYRQNSGIWSQKPITMIKKVAMSQGFRLCFSDELGGFPYTAEELPDNMTTPIKIEAKEETVGGTEIPAEVAELPKGDFKKAFIAIANSADLQAINKIREGLNQRSWTEEETSSLLQAIDGKVTELTPKE